MKTIIALFISVVSIQLIAQVPLTPWTQLGPIQFPINASGQINGIGRTCQLKFHPTDTSKIYAATASGGAYFSTNLGVSWQAYTGSQYLPTQSLASICIDAMNDSIVYLGTGDANYYGGTSTGVWKSTNRGTSFVQKNSGMGSRIVLELLQFPSARHHFIAATNNGIYKSVDTTNTWTLQTISGLQFTDMDFKPGTNGRVIYASTYDSAYRSLDYGVTWQTIKNNGFYIPVGSGGGQGVRVAVCASDTNILYIAMVKNYGTIFKSTNGGNTFSVMKDSVMPNLTGYNNVLGDAGQGNYDFDFNCDPSNSSVVYLVGHNIWKSTNSGAGWNQLTNWWAIVHTDMHQFAFSPHNPRHHFDVNDGGIWYTRDNDSTWVQRSDGLAATEVAPAACSKLNKDFISVGTQDNGELYKDASGWKTNRGGDWYVNMEYDWINPTTVYYCSGSRRIVSGSSTSLGFPFTGDATFISFNSKSKETALAASGKKLYITKNLSASPPAWQLVDSFLNTIICVGWSTFDTNKLYVVTRNAKIYYSSNLFSAGASFISRNTPGSTSVAAAVTTITNKDSVIYLSCGNRIYRSQNYAFSFTDVSLNYPTINVMNLYHDPFTLDESVFAAGNLAVFYHKDTMTSWQNVTQNLPTIASAQRQIAFNDGSSNAELRIAYYGKGIWSIPIQTNRIPAINFSADTTTFCRGQVVHFFDSTVNSPSSWNWAFPGGLPSSSTARNPIITYNNKGIFPVTLSATNSVGTNSLTKISFIRVISDSIPIAENFETSILPNNWENFDAIGDGQKWEYINGISGFGVGSKCYRFDNYNLDTRPNRDAIITTRYDFYPYDSVWMSFDRAHAPYSGANRDSLEVLVAGNCGGVYNSVWLKGYGQLATAPSLTDSLFIPLATQWKKDTINLKSYAGQVGVKIQFKNLPGYGQTIYIDNINIWGVKIPPIANAGRDSSICAGAPVRIGMTANPLVRYEWSPSTALSSDTVSNPIARPSSTTTYILKATSQRNDLVAYDTIKITVYPAPTADAGLNDTVCEGTQITIGSPAITGTTYLWSPSTNLSSNIISEPIATVNSAITYVLQTINSASGCKNYDTILLATLPSSTGAKTQSICFGTSYFFNGVNRSTSGTYIDTLVNFSGCDSFITLTLNIRSISNGILNESICANDSYLFNGINLSAAGTYLDTSSNTSGCDSVITLNLAVNSINNGITQAANVLTAVQIGAAYQWINCDNNTPIPSETNQSFVAATTGHFAVVITLGSCSDTSNCINVVNSGVFRLNDESPIAIYPNPANQSITVQSAIKDACFIEIQNNVGELVLKKYLSTGIETVDISKLASAIYQVQVKNKSGSILYHDKLNVIR